MNKTIILFLIYFFSFQACNLKKEPLTINAEKEIVIDEIKKSRNDSIIKDFKYIKLETNDDCLVGAIDKILFRNNIYILDKKIAKSLFVFNLSGRFLFKLRNIGKGPGEFISINDFDIDVNGNIYILDIYGKKIINFDSQGEYLKEIKLNFYSHSFCYLGLDQFVLNQNDLSDNVFNIIYWKNGVSEKKYFPYRKSIDDKQGFHTVEYRIHHSRNSIMYCPKYTHILYNIATEGISEKYIFNFGQKKEIPLDYLKSISFRDQIDYLMNSDVVWYLDNFYETEKVVSFTFMYKQRKWTIFYSKETSKYELYDCLPCIGMKNNILGNLYPLGVFENQFIAKIDFSQIVSLKKNPESILYKENLQLLNSLTTFPNPVLVLYELNDF